jgi:hypothetical protein
MVRGSPSRRTSSRWGASGASKRRVTAVGDLLQGDSLPLSKLGPVIPQCIPRRHGKFSLDTLYQTWVRLWRLINIKLQRFLLPGGSLPRANFPSEHLSSTTPTEPRNTVPDASCKTQLSQGALLAPQNARQAAHCLMAKMPYVALYIAQGTLIKNTSKNDDNGSRWVAFCVLGATLTDNDAVACDLCRKLRPRIPQLSHHYTLT